MTPKHPKCGCSQKRYTYFRKRYRNQTLHLKRRCADCGKTAQNPMRQDEYDRAWVETLPIETKRRSGAACAVSRRASAIDAAICENEKQGADSR